jgi:Mrp family chromosome partitioning ATPase
LKTLLITSPLPGDGKSTVALNLATALSESGKVPVLLLEADVYRPTLIEKLGLKQWPGLTECYKHGDHPMLAIRRINPLGFYLLPAGQPVTAGVSFFESNFASQLFKGLSSSYFSWILIDSPPAIPVANILALRAHADATLLVARAGETPQEAIEETTRHLEPDHVLGIILNGVEGINRAYARYYGYGGYEARSKHAKSKTIVGLGLDEHAR